MNKRKKLTESQMAAVAFAADNRGRVQTPRFARSTMKSLKDLGVVRFVGSTPYYSGVGGEMFYRLTADGWAMAAAGRMFSAFRCEVR